MANDKQQDARDAFDASRRRRREAAMIDATATDLTPPAAGQKPSAGPTPQPSAGTTPEAAASPGAPPPPVVEPARGLGAIPASLLGGVAGAAIASLIFLAASPKDSTAEVQNRLAAFDARLKGVPGAEALAALDKRLGAAEQQARSAATSAGAAEGVGRSAEGLAKAATGAADAARQEAQRVAAALAALPKPAAPASAVDLTPLAARVTRAEDALARAETSAKQAVVAALKPVEDRVAQVEQRPVVAVKPLEDRLALVEQATRGALDDVQRRLAAIEPRIAAPVDIKPVTEGLAQLDRRLAPVEARLAEQKSEARVTASPDAAVGAAASRATAVAVAAQAAQQALERGAPYQVELATLEGLGVDAVKLAPLKRFAATGAPTARALAGAFAPLANTVAANAGAQDAPQGVGDRLLSAAGRLVQIRKVGESGDDAAALTSRIESALARGAVGDALAAWAKLPGPAKAASQAFGSDLAGRVAADDAVRAVQGEAFATLGRKS